MQDWSTEDYTRCYGDSLYVAPQDSDAGIYLDEGYDDLGRRRPDPGRARLPAGEYLRDSAYVAPAHATHWSRAQSDHYPAALNTPGCRGGAPPLGGPPPSWAYGPQRIAAPCRSNARDYDQEFYDQRRDLSYNRQAEQQQRASQISASGGSNRGRKEGFAGVGFHQSDRGALQPIYSVNWDERPMGYNPNAGPAWARLVPGQAHSPVPAPCASAYPGVPTEVNGMSAQSWAQNTPWNSGPPTWPGPSTYGGGTKERFGGPGTTTPATPGADSSGILGFSIEQIQLVFLFIILVMLSMILRAVEQRNAVIYASAQNQSAPALAL
jgi:hypothetical protein